QLGVSEFFDVVLLGLAQLPEQRHHDQDDHPNEDHPVRKPRIAVVARAFQSGQPTLFIVVIFHCDKSTLIYFTGGHCATAKKLRQPSTRLRPMQQDRFARSRPAVMILTRAWLFSTPLVAL